MRNLLIFLVFPECFRLHPQFLCLLQIVFSHSGVYSLVEEAAFFLGSKLAKILVPKKFSLEKVKGVQDLVELSKKSCYQYFPPVLIVLLVF